MKAVHYVCPILAKIRMRQQILVLLSRKFLETPFSVSHVSSGVQTDEKIVTDAIKPPS
jgi:hypothetical protein